MPYIPFSSSNKSQSKEDYINEAVVGERKKYLEDIILSEKEKRAKLLEFSALEELTNAAKNSLSFFSDKLQQFSMNQ